MYAPSQGAAMALIFTIMLMLASYGLNVAVQRQPAAPAITTDRAAVSQS